MSVTAKRSIILLFLFISVFLLVDNRFTETIKIACTSLLFLIIPRSISEVSLLFEKVFRSLHLFFTCLFCCCKSFLTPKTLPLFHSQSFRQICILCHKMQAARRSGFPYIVPISFFRFLYLFYIN